MNHSQYSINQIKQPLPLTSQQQVTSTLLEDAELALENLAWKEVQLVRESEELFKKQVEYMKMVDQLRKFVPNMQKIDSDTKKLSTLIDSPSSLVEEVCAKVRNIDLARDRVDDCLSKLGDVLDLSTCRDGMMNAMKLGHYEEAAINIKRYLSIDQKELQNTLRIICEESNSNTDNSTDNFQNSSLDPMSMTVALDQLEEAKVKLLEICKSNLVLAIKEEDTKEIERYFKIFPMLNEHDQGLKRYSEYLSTKIINPLEVESLKTKKLNQSDKLSALFECIAKLIDSNQPLVETYYGPGHLISVIKVIQKECDRLSRKVLEEFRNETKLKDVVKIVKSSLLQALGPFPANSQMYNSQNFTINLKPSILDPREVDKILHEIPVIISRSETYLDFVVKRVLNDMNLLAENEQQKQSVQIEVYNLICIECELNTLIQEVSGIHVVLEQFYLNESSKKAIQMDQTVAESSSCFVSSMLDDIFFIIKKCTKRAVSTKSIQVFCAIINHCVTLLESTFCKFLEHKLNNQQYFSTAAFNTRNLDFSQAYSAIQSGRYSLQSTGESEIARTQYFSALNSLDKACDYIHTLKGILLEDIKKLKPSLTVHQSKQDTDREMEKPKACLNELLQLSNKFTSVINSSLYQLFNSQFRNRLRDELKTILIENPDLPSDSNAVEGLARTLLLRLDRSIQNYMTGENYNKLISITRDSLASSFQKK